MKENQIVFLFIVIGGITWIIAVVVMDYMEKKLPEKRNKEGALTFRNLHQFRFLQTKYDILWTYVVDSKDRLYGVCQIWIDEETRQLCMAFVKFKRSGFSLCNEAKTTEEMSALAYDLAILEHAFRSWHQEGAWVMALWSEALQYAQEQRAALLMLLNQAGQPINEAQKQRQEATQQAEVEPQKLTNIGGVALVFKDQGRATAFRLEYVPKGDYSIRFGERSVEMATSDGKMDVPINLFSSTPLASGRLVITSLQNQQADEVLW
jgi:hypothetical protein